MCLSTFTRTTMLLQMPGASRSKGCKRQPGSRELAKVDKWTGQRYVGCWRHLRAGGQGLHGQDAGITTGIPGRPPGPVLRPLPQIAALHESP